MTGGGGGEERRGKASNNTLNYFGKLDRGFSVGGMGVRGEEGSSMGVMGSRALFFYFACFTIIHLLTLQAPSQFSRTKYQGVTAPPLPPLPPSFLLVFLLILFSLSSSFSPS